jgi:HEAT repeat protein
MVMENFYLFIGKVTYQTTAVLFALCVLFIFFSLLIHHLKLLIVKIKSVAKQSMFNVVFRYYFNEIHVDQIKHRRFQREVLTEAFLSIISLITGEKQRHMKRGVYELGLVGVIEKGLSSASISKRMRSCFMLGQLKSERAADSLASVLFDTNQRVTTSAIIALGELEDASTLPSLINYFRVCPYSQAWLTAAILPVFENLVYDYVKVYFKSGMLPVNKLLLLIKILASLRISESIEVLRNIYEESDNIEIRINSLKAIGKINDLSSLKVIMDALSDKDWQIRAVACKVLGEMAIKGAVSRLQPLLEDKNWYVRKNAANALVKLGKIGTYALLAFMNTDDKYAKDMIVHALEEEGIVEQAVFDMISGNNDKKRWAAEIIRTLLKNGYKKLLNNYCDLCEFVKAEIDKRELS